MPLVRLTGSFERSVLAEAGAAVHEAMVSCLNVPADDIFRVINAVREDEIVADSGYLGVERRRPLFIEITLRAGRTDEAKRTFYRTVAENVAKRGIIRREDLLIALSENNPVDWSFGNGIAQYVT